MVKNCLSIDVEGFIESNLQSFTIDNKYISKTQETYEIEKNVNTILTLLDDLNIRATFFYLGRIGRDIPNIVKETAQNGHEIACHSFDHHRIYGLTQEIFKDRLICAKRTLEDVSGQAVYGFRAPDFSITKSSVWALDTLKEVGFDYDSSICPTDIHDVYGISDANPFIHQLQNGLVEFPISTIKFFHKRYPYGGGGYFRLYPIFLTKYLITRINETGHPFMLYMHPYEIGPVIPRVTELSSYRMFRHYYNCTNGSQRLRRILKAYEFSTALEILKRGNLLN